MFESVSRANKWQQIILQCVDRQQAEGRHSSGHRVNFGLCRVQTRAKVNLAEPQTAIKNPQ